MRRAILPRHIHPAPPAFQELEAVDLALGLAATPGLGRGGAHSGAIRFQPSSEGRNGGNAACASIGRLSLQLGSRAGRSAAVPPTGDAASPRQCREPAREPRDSRSLLVLPDRTEIRRLREQSGFGSTAIARRLSRLLKNPSRVVERCDSLLWLRNPVKAIA